MKNLKIFLITTVVILGSIVVEAKSIYNNPYPRSENAAQQICEDNGGYFIGSIALIKRTSDGEVHEGGPDQDKIEKNFTTFLQLIRTQSGVDEKYGQPENWEWLEARFICYEVQRDAISFILRAVSFDGSFMKNYELTYIYSGSEVFDKQTNQIKLSEMRLEQESSIGFFVDGGILRSEARLDTPFVKAVLQVALEEVPELQMTQP